VLPCFNLVVVNWSLVAAGHVPYRNSRLTMLLKDSLGGDAKARLTGLVAPGPFFALGLLVFSQVGFTKNCLKHLPFGDG
jgi:hypothetical protein